MDELLEMISNVMPTLYEKASAGDIAKIRGRPNTLSF